MFCAKSVLYSPSACRQSFESYDHESVNVKPEIDAVILALPKETMLKGSGTEFECGSCNCPETLIIPPMALSPYRLKSSQVDEAMQ